MSHGKAVRGALIAPTRALRQAIPEVRPATIHGARAFDAFREFYEQRAEYDPAT